MANNSFKADAFSAALTPTLGFMMEFSYQEILNRASREADEFSLVWRHEFKFAQSASLIQDRLASHLVSEAISSSWLSTDLIGSKATVRRYRVNPESLAVLAGVQGIYDWLAPKLPEDLAFYKGVNVLFGSIAHEHEAWLNET